ncbi:hypothetical protein NG831_06400 [Xanthomonas sacchari]|uniref:hypothetical protein n=1 Tax=Xanthomonas sacchari TaxID=56458 RepID=UPI00224DB0B9|nr:hypothetical protein [Xanthomonas sacchari]MCW0413506.1 hypothetical protein [Xanthomonas sacchari]UYK67790.1 hypothetical protein NG831_06400 [Xanthomonas sacchari]
MRLIALLKSWLRPDPADALKGAEDEVLLWDERMALIAETSFWGIVVPAYLASLSSALELKREMASRSATPQHPNNKPLADPLGSEDAAPVSDDLHDV